MPRIRDPEEEDMMATCPRCKGATTVYRMDLEATGECPLCEGEGRVTRATYERYTSGLG